MRWPHSCFHLLPVLLLLGLPMTGLCAAKPAPSSPLAPPSAIPAALPDYGGRDAPGVLDGVGGAAPNPVAQAGRSALALAVVLGGMVGVVALLKRAGYKGGEPVLPVLLAALRPASTGSAHTKAGAAASTGPLSLVQSQALPGGGAVHLLSLHGKTLVLVGATTQGVSLLAEWETEEAEALETAKKAAPTQAPFRDYLARATPAPDPPKPQTLNQLSDLLAGARVRAAEEKHE